MLSDDQAESIARATTLFDSLDPEAHANYFRLSSTGVRGLIESLRARSGRDYLLDDRLVEAPLHCFYPDNLLVAIANWLSRPGKASPDILIDEKEAEAWRAQSRELVRQFRSEQINFELDPEIENIFSVGAQTKIDSGPFDLSAVLLNRVNKITPLGLGAGELDKFTEAVSGGLFRRWPGARITGAIQIERIDRAICRSVSRPGEYFSDYTPGQLLGGNYAETLMIEEVGLLRLLFHPEFGATGKWRRDWSLFCRAVSDGSTPRGYGRAGTAPLERFIEKTLDDAYQRWSEVRNCWIQGALQPTFDHERVEAGSESDSGRCSISR